MKRTPIGVFRLYLLTVAALAAAATTMTTLCTGSPTPKPASAERRLYIGNVTAKMLIGGGGGQSHYQSLNCYDNMNCKGNSIRVGAANVPDLALDPYYFDNKIVSCLYDGIYLLYDYTFYNRWNLNGGVYAEAWGENFCVNMGEFARKASSIRLTGAPNGYKYDTLNFYEGEFYNGAEQYFYEDSPSVDFDNFGRSMIVTGCAPWTLYEYDEYEGRKVCVYPSTDGSCTPRFYRSPQYMYGMANRVSSVRRGCFSKLKTYGSEGAINQMPVGKYMHG